MNIIQEFENLPNFWCNCDHFDYKENICWLS